MENRGVWKVLAKPGKKLRLGMKVVFAEDFIGEVVAKELDGTVLVQFADDDMIVREKANKYGEVPLPPYVEKSESSEQTSKENNYQTVYAKHEGSVAAPTAGFHFTSELIEKLKTKGVEFAEVTLHVGLGTFLPVKSDKVEEH
jgi:S-adenosylmethionine:tRNA ribosyltransferase-isomerase